MEQVMQTNRNATARPPASASMHAPLRPTSVGVYLLMDRIRRVLFDIVLVAGVMAGYSCTEPEHAKGPYVTTVISEHGERPVCQPVAGEWGATVNGLQARIVAAASQVVRAKSPRDDRVCIRAVVEFRNRGTEVVKIPFEPRIPFLPNPPETSAWFDGMLSFDGVSWTTGDTGTRRISENPSANELVLGPSKTATIEVGEDVRLCRWRGPEATFRYVVRSEYPSQPPYSYWRGEITTGPCRIRGDIPKVRPMDP